MVKAISSGASGLVSVNIPSVMPYDCWTAQEKAAESLLASFAVNRAPPTWMDSRLERSTGYQSSASDGTAVIVVTFAEEINGNTSSGLTLSAKMTVPPFSSAPSAPGHASGKLWHIDKAARYFVFSEKSDREAASTKLYT